MLFDFLARHSSHHFIVIDDTFDVALLKVVPSSSAAAGPDPAKISKPEKEMQYIHDRLVSTCVTKGNHIFPTFEYTIKWTMHELHHDLDTALICVDDVMLFHIIGIEFTNNCETPNQI
jgi:hypothetical protein